MNDQGKNAKPQRSPWTPRINFNFPLIWTKIVTSLLEGTAQPQGPRQELCFPAHPAWQHPETPLAPSTAEPQRRAFGCIPEKNGHAASRRPQGFSCSRKGRGLTPVAAAPGGAFPSSALAVVRIRESGFVLLCVPGYGQFWGALILYHTMASGKGRKRGQISQITDWTF